MKNKFLLLLLTFIFFDCNSQTTNKYNLDFEAYNHLMKLPSDWYLWGRFSIISDSITVHSGKYASKITSTKSGGSFGAIAYTIPANYIGESIKLEGYIKIKNVEDGYVGLMLRIDGGGETLAFDNMQEKNINGTRDWQKYTISMPYPKEAENIYIAGLLAGKGEAWFDDFLLTIDGKDVQTIEKEEVVFKANLDKEFDLGSKILFPELNVTLIHNLDLLGKIWGFLKYHHPAIGAGNYNWDYELFRILPKYIKVQSTNERDGVLSRWIEKYEEIEVCKTCKEISKDAIVKPDMSWLNQYDMGSELRDKLSYIYKNRHQGSGFYIKVTSHSNAEFLNESLYPTMHYPDDGYRLLALYKYWNMIHYFFPYKHLTDKKWSGVLEEYIPKLINAKNDLEYELALVKLFNDINDTHASLASGFNYINAKRGNNYAPFKVQFVENELVVTDYYNPELRTGSSPKVGDIITHINNTPVATITDSLSSYYPASNEAAKMRNIAKDLLRSPKKEIAISYLSKDQKRKLNLPLYPKDNLDMKWYKWNGEKSFKVLDNNIGYVTLATVTENDVPQLKAAFKNTKGIIIDIRNYPHAFVTFTLGSFFVSDATPFVKFAQMNINNPGEFKLKNAVEIPNSTEKYNGKVIVLVNEMSQSQSEYTAMAFRAGDNTTIIGSTTAGADGDVSYIHLPGGITTTISGVGVYYPDGTETQRIGIIPDIKIKPTIKGIIDGKDEVLEKAIETILKE